MRKKFVIERGILDLKTHFQKEKAMSSEEREIRSLLRPFARFQSFQEHEDLINSLLKEIELKDAVEQLLLAKHIGCQNLDDLERLVFDSDNSNKIDKVVKDLKMCLEKEKFLEQKNERKKKDVGIRAERAKDKKNRQKQQEESLEGAKNYNLLYNETKLCEKIGLKIPEYLLLKEILIREFVEEGKVSRNKIKSVIQLDPKTLDSVFDFMDKNNLIIEDYEN